MVLIGEFSLVEGTSTTRILERMQCECRSFNEVPKLARGSSLRHGATKNEVHGTVAFS